MLDLSRLQHWVKVNDSSFIQYLSSCLDLLFNV
jgi:hypothetical protein